MLVCQREMSHLMRENCTDIRDAARRYVARCAEMQTPPRVSEFAALLAMTRARLAERFRAHGVTAAEYLLAHQVGIALYLLAETKKTNAAVAARAALVPRVRSTAPSRAQRA